MEALDLSLGIFLVQSVEDDLHAVRLMLYHRLGSLTPRDLQQQSRGGHLLRFIGDLTALRQWISLGLARLIVASITAVAALTALAFINVTLTATVAGVLAIVDATSSSAIGGSVAWFYGEESVVDPRKLAEEILHAVHEGLAAPTAFPMV